jgi:glutaryl-CoA dehydrogenase
MSATRIRTQARPVYTGIGKALGTDYFLLKDTLSASELDYLERTRRFVHEEVLPVINDYWERADVPLGLFRRLGQLGLVGDGIEGYGCPPMSAIAAGLVTMELNRGDGSVGTFLGVQAGLAMRSVPRSRRSAGCPRWRGARCSAPLRSLSPSTDPTRCHSKPRRDATVTRT